MSTIQWFPGHMAKTKRLIKDNLKKVDMVIEVLDARAPAASSNPLLGELIEHKPRIALLNKDDLADSKVTDLWCDVINKNQEIVPLRISAISKKSTRSIAKTCRKVWAEKRPATTWHGPVRAMIVGIPNVGKSTIINSLCGNKKVHTGAKPGLTQHLQRIPVSHELELFDTPGLLWHKFEDVQTGVILAALGAIKESVLPQQEVAQHILAFLAAHYPDQLSSCYKFDVLSVEPSQLLEEVSRRNGCMSGGNRLDYPRVCQLILKDLREGRCGAVSLEKPHQLESKAFQ